MKTVRTNTSDKLRLTGFLSEPKSKNKDSIIVHIHGMAGDPYTNTWYPHFHALFPQNNVAFLVGNHRGTGSITMFFREPDKYPNYGDAFERFEDSVIDIDAWVKYAEKLGYKNIHIQSHSLAPSKVVYYMNKKKNNKIKTLTFISPVDMLGSTLADKKLHKQMITEANKFVKEGKEKKMLSSLLDGEYFISAGTYLNFFTEKSKCNIFCYTDRKHNWKMINNIDKPVLIIGGNKDLAIETIIDTSKAHSILKHQLKKSPKVITKVYEGAEHSFEGFEKKIVSDVIKFIN